MRWSIPARAVLAALTATAVVVAVAGCTTSGRTTLQYGIWDRTQLPAMNRIVAGFERAHPDIDVRVTVTPWDAYWTKLRTAASSRTAPDVFWMTQDQFPLYADGGALLPLQDRIDRDRFDTEAFLPSTVRAFTFRGDLAGVPKDTNSFGVFCNTRLFAAAGVPLPDASWTWADLRRTARRLTDPAKGVHGVAAPVADVLGYYLTIPQAGGAVMRADGRSGYADPRTLDGVRFWTDLIRDGSSPSVQQMTDTDPLQMFLSGKVAMYYGGSWDPVAVADVPEAKAFTRIAPLPRGAQRGFYANGLANVAAASTQHPDQAWLLLQYLGSRRAAEIQAETGTVIPAYRGLESVYARSIPGLDLHVLTDQLPDARPIPASVNTAVWSENALREFTKAWSGEETVEQAGRRAADFMDAALEKEAR